MLISKRDNRTYIYHLSVTQKLNTLAQFPVDFLPNPAVACSCCPSVPVFCLSLYIIKKDKKLVNMFISIFIWPALAIFLNSIYFSSFLVSMALFCTVINNLPVSLCLICLLKYWCSFSFGFTFL